MRALTKGFLGTPWIQFIRNLDGIGRARYFCLGGKRYRRTAVNIRTVIEGDGKHFEWKRKGIVHGGTCLDGSPRRW